jgi:hypothetical protein
VEPRLAIPGSRRSVSPPYYSLSRNRVATPDAAGSIYHSRPPPAPSLASTEPPRPPLLVPHTRHLRGRLERPRHQTLAPSSPGPAGSPPSPTTTIPTFFFALSIYTVSSSSAHGHARQGAAITGRAARWPWSSPPGPSRDSRGRGSATACAVSTTLLLLILFYQVSANPFSLLMQQSLQMRLASTRFSVHTMYCVSIHVRTGWF